MAIGEILRGGKSFFGKQVVLYGEMHSEEERVRIWANGESCFFDQ
jgi:hypothetical protein